MRKRISVSGSFFSLLLVLLILSSVPLTGESRAQTPEAPPELHKTTMYLKEAMELSPIEPDEETAYQAVAIPNGFVRTGLFGYRIIPTGGTEWKSVASWKTQPLKNRMVLGGTLDVTVYAYKEETDGTSPNSQFRFEIVRNENEVLLSVETRTYNLVEGTKIRINAQGAFPPGNDTAIEAGQVLTFRIMAKSNGGGATIRFGNNNFLSMFTFSTNSLHIQDVRMTSDEVILEYWDSMMLPWTELHTQLEINRIVIPNNDLTSRFNSVNRTRLIVWDRDNSPGEYNVRVSLGYSIAENLTMTKNVELEGDKRSWFDIANIVGMVQGNSTVIVLIVIALVLLMTLVRWRKRVWNRRIRGLPPDLKGKSRKESKRAWKRRKKELRRELKRRRKGLIVEEDDEEIDEMDDREFDFFRKRILEGDQSSGS